MDGKKQELRKYVGLTLNQLNTKFPIDTLTYPIMYMAQALAGITTDLSCQSWTALS